MEWVGLDMGDPKMCGLLGGFQFKNDPQKQVSSRKTDPWSGSLWLP